MNTQATFPIFPKRRFHKLFAWIDKLEYSFWSIGGTLAITSLYFTQTLLPEHKTFYWSVTFIGWSFLLIGLGIYLYRKKVKQSFDGKISFDNNGIQINTSEGEQIWSWDQVQRMDVYLYCGFPHRRYPSVLSAFVNENIFENLFIKTEILHVRIQVDNRFHSFYVMNKFPKSKRKGVLYHHLKALRTVSLVLHRKIQFWDKRRFAA